MSWSMAHGTVRTRGVCVCVCCWGCILLNWVHSAYLGIQEQGQYLIDSNFVTK